MTHSPTPDHTATGTTTATATGTDAGINAGIDAGIDAGTLATLPDFELGLPGPQQDFLVARALSGVKTATSSLWVHHRMDGEDLPVPGARYALIDGRGRRAAVLVTEVRMLRLADVGDDVARDEGEDFADAAAWRTAHVDFWRQWDGEVAAHLGTTSWTVGDDDVVVVQYFRVLPVRDAPDQALRQT